MTEHLMAIPATTEAPDNDQSAAFALPDTLPRSRFVKLPGRGRMHFREIANPGKPVLLLVHGMVATGTVNWFAAFEALAKDFHVIAPDMRGHGRSLRNTKKFKVRYCADDLAALLGELGIPKVTAVGYSMGGAIIQHLWDRHPHLIEGAVFAATGFDAPVSSNIRPVARTAMRLLIMQSRIIEKLMGLNDARAARKLRRTLRRRRLPKTPNQRQERTTSHVMRSDLRRTSVRTLLESAREMVTHDMGHMIDRVDVPSAVMATLNDATFSAEHQVEMARRLPHSRLFTFEEGHLFCSNAAFGAALAEICHDVVGRRSVKQSRSNHKVQLRAVR